jgi:3-hydroxyisobutyrate dehydrogenase
VTDPGLARREKVRAVAPELARITETVLFGQVWERPGLSKRDRSLITLACLLSTGRWDQFGVHLARGLDNGVTREEISELITHLAFYAGWPSGAGWAETPAAAAAEADVVFTSLPGPAESEAMASAPDGILAGMKPGSAWFDLTTSSPAMVRKVHGLAASKDVTMLDAPVSGGPAGAASGRLTVWVSGDLATFERHRSLLDSIADQVMHLGGGGQATIAKLAHNYCAYAINRLVAEIFATSVKAGAEPLALWHALRRGAVGRRRTFDALGDHFLTADYDPPAFSLALARKDIALARQMGRDVGVPMEVADIILENMDEAIAQGWEGRDSRSPMALLLEQAGVRIALGPDLIQQELQQAGD